MKLYEKRNQEYAEIQKRREKEKAEIRQLLSETLLLDNIEILEIKERKNDEICYEVYLAFTLDEYRQEENFSWRESESQEDFILKVKRSIDYIKELRNQYPDYCKQNDFIQQNSKYRKCFNLTHMGYNHNYYFDVQLADYLKLPNTTSCSCGGGDYEIKRTPGRVSEYNNNIDKTIDFLIDCITDLKKMKYISKNI